jgi:hypothetical protein
MEDVARGVWTLPKDAKPLYLARLAFLNPEQVALGNKVTKAPEGKSLETQVTKFLGILTVGQLSVDLGRPELLEIARQAATACGHNYKRTIAGNVAMRATLADDPLTPDAALLEAMLEAQNVKATPETASDAWAKLAEGFDAFVSAHGAVVHGVNAKLPDAMAEFAQRMTKLGKYVTLVDAEDAAREG